MKWWLILLLASAALGLGLLSDRPEATGVVPFDHEAHDGLFPLCTTCHAGIETGDEDAWYPQHRDCNACHDGQRADRVEWWRPLRPSGHLRFSHPEHAAALGDSTLECQDCHGDGDPGFRIVAYPAEADDCRACHAHDASGHLAADSDCSVCHNPLAEAPGLLSADIAAFARPADHDAPDFLHDHRPEDLVRCATCHARESCERCHRNATELADVMALSPDPRMAKLMAGTLASHPAPPSHVDPGWLADHGDAARLDLTSCANCHSSTSCSDCHREGTAAELASRLPALRDGEPRSVPARERPGFHPLDYANGHALDAAADPIRCQACHTETSCQDCHDAGQGAGYHPTGFLAGHATETYGGQDCGSCHSLEAFCRDCHAASGAAPGARRVGTFHDARSLWLLSHGDAARTQLTSCASCHAQTDCLKCHAVGRGWGVNPHGPDFDPGVIGRQNRIACLLCHPQDPLR